MSASFGFQVVQAYINVVLAKSVLQFAKDDLENYRRSWISITTALKPAISRKAII